MIKRKISINDYRDFSVSGDTLWGALIGLTDTGNIIHYTGQTNTNAYLARIPILFTETIDDLGYYTPIIDYWANNTMYYSGTTVIYNDNTYICKVNHVSTNTFNHDNWDKTPNDSNSTTVELTGDTRINLFKRFGKTELDSDLYNPSWNIDFTQIIKTSDGMVKKITGERESPIGSIQNLYDYEISDENSELTIKYSDIDLKNSKISYNTSGLTSDNAINGPKIKLDYLIGLIDRPKINIDVFIDRGNNASFEKHTKLGEVKSMYDLERYGNGYFNIKES